MSATADSSDGELSEAKHLYYWLNERVDRKDPRWKAWPRPESVRGCVAASLRSE